MTTYVGPFPFETLPAYPGVYLCFWMTAEGTIRRSLRKWDGQKWYTGIGSAPVSSLRISELPMPAIVYTDVRAAAEVTTPLLGAPKRIDTPPHYAWWGLSEPTGNL
jgi:hypothetical protein